MKHDDGALHAIHAIGIFFGWIPSGRKVVDFRSHQIGRPLVHFIDDEFEVIFDQVLLVTIEEFRFEELRGNVEILGHVLIILFGELSDAKEHASFGFAFDI